MAICTQTILRITISRQVEGTLNTLEFVKVPTKIKTKKQF